MFEEEYQLDFFKNNGFERKTCKKCGDAFWSQDPKAGLCGDTPCVEYDFLDEPVFTKSLTLDSMRELFLSFFERHGHTRLNRYPVIPRWRDDVLLVNASIYDFQPHVTSGLVPPPANPLVVSQPCIRMNDLESVGRTGRHLTAFEMLGHHSFNSDTEFIYWKDETVSYCHEMLTKDLGAASERVIYKEKPWIGGGNAGPSVEVLLGGLEVATLVFMNQKRDDNGELVLDGQKYSPLSLNVVDTGYGLERFVWASLEAPTIYDAIYPEMISKLSELAGISRDVNDSRYSRILREHAKLAGIIDAVSAKGAEEIRALCVKRLAAKDITITTSELSDILRPLEGIFSCVDHTRSLAFMVGDGMVPSNTKGGYLVRLLIRRTLRLLEELNIDVKLSELVLSQYDRFADLFPTRDEKTLVTMIDLEQERYAETLGKGKRLIGRILTEKKGKPLDVTALVDLYDTHGIHPTLVRTIGKEEGTPIEIPSDFDSLLAKRHEKADTRTEAKKSHDWNLPKTRLLYYEDANTWETDAKVLFSDDERIVLDRTIFYPEGGGQPHDVGTISAGDKTVNVISTQKEGDVVVHYVNGSLSVGETVQIKVDQFRRLSLMRHHTATHLILAASREILGDHVWQTGAQKGVTSSRVDITHYERLTLDKLQEIEFRANEYVLEGKPVSKKEMPREEAEKKFGFRLFQGGVPLAKEIRVVDIPGVDSEACGGTHVENTSDIGLIKIIKAERIQDGVTRLEFAAGPHALAEVQKQESLLHKASDVFSVNPEKLPQTAERFFLEWKEQRRKLDGYAKDDAKGLTETIHGEMTQIDGVDFIAKQLNASSNDILSVAKQLASEWENLIGVIGTTQDGGRIICLRTLDAGINCSNILKKATEAVLGKPKGGGRPDFAQSGGIDPADVEKIIAEARRLIEAALKGE